jgi:diguanylate cyclase (GGDEF)-like protein
MASARDELLQRFPESGSARVLVVDDHEFMHRLIRVRLRGESLEVVSAWTCHEAIEKARHERPDLILLDIDLPDGSGLTVIRTLKDTEATRDIPIICISASEALPDRDGWNHLGEMDFLRKPFDTGELLARVRGGLRLGRALRLLQTKARLDGLTGLWNREYFDARLAAEWNEAVRHGLPLSLVLCDLDGFKRINDRHGHPFGDQVLERFARILASGRGSDVACRYGGEEFAVILPNTDAHEAFEAAERWRQAIARETWPTRPDFRASASFGVADLDLRHPAGPAALVEAADTALYEAKRRGRDRVDLADPVSTLARPDDRHAG